MDSARATRGAQWILFFNVFQKLLTFGMNQVIVRQSSPEVFGIAAVQLELLLSTLLFLSREGIRLALLRSVVVDHRGLQQFVNLSWLPALLVTLFTSIIFVYCPSFVGGMDRSVVLLYCGGALLESLGEPLFNLYNQCFRVDCRLAADAMAITVRSIVTFVAIIYYDVGVLGFGLAQLSFGGVHVIVMLRSFAQVEFCAEGSELKEYKLRIADLLPGVPEQRQSSGGVIDCLFGAQAAGNAVHMSGTSLLKHGLTEADKIALSLSTAATHYDQGVYGVIHNYGSLVARMVFQPVEETARIAFSKMAAKARLLDGQDNDKDQGQRQREAVQAEVSAMASMVAIVLKTVGLFSVLFPVFGPFYARVAVQFGLGVRWYREETVRALAVYCVYILVLGLNGVSEAFVYATAPPGLLGTVNLSLVVSSLAFCLSSVLLIQRMGTSGILVANIFAMSIRIVFNLVYTHKYFATPHKLFPSSFSEKGSRNGLNQPLTPLSDACVHVQDVAGLAVASGVLYLSCARYAASLMTLRSAGEHVLVGTACFLVVLALLYQSHRAEFVQLLGAVRSRRTRSSEDEKGKMKSE